MVRAVVSSIWWCFGLAPFACLGLLAFEIGVAGDSEGHAVEVSWWVAPLGVAALIVAGTCGWQWTRPRSTPGAELTRALLLALPGSYAPTLLALPAGELLHGRLAPARMPTALALWVTVYAMWVGVILVVRSPRVEAQA